MPKAGLKPIHHVDEWWECPVCDEYKFKSSEEVEKGLKFVPQSPFELGDKIHYIGGAKVGWVSDIEIYAQGDRSAHEHVMRITVSSPSGGASMFYIRADEDETRQLALDTD